MRMDGKDASLVGDLRELTHSSLDNNVMLCYII